ncbi:probable peptidyl-tRNA hydrolase [Thamnophis elegans]|uniref:probable peptidyl-tRNA hydrolase n=1 Tax=Thamnophis elegans TaxID=35005 RepID=UPI0013777136|nr:probable peptidyl-tRNA hydrolase [Thamnophis elegans]
MMRPQPLGQLLRWALGHRSDELQTAQKRVMVAGLGNHTFPGTRHSVGMAVLNHLASKLDVADQWKRDKQCCADVAMARLGEAELLLMKPRKFMNLNGISVVTAAERYNLDIEEIYLVHDDLDRPLGKLSLKLGGSARGHNGVRSCISSLRSDRMVRLRVGIGRPTEKASVEDYVLSRFTDAEQEVLPPVLERAATVLLQHIQQNCGERELPGSCDGHVSPPPKTEGRGPS